jgi:ATP-GRASP peptide maturase of grasp-with-spasm system
MGVTDVLRINKEDWQGRTVSIHLTDHTWRFTYGDTDVELSQVTAVWYRKGNFWFDNLGAQIELPDHPKLEEMLNARMAVENSRACEYFHYLLAARVPTLGHDGISRLNKLLVLAIAREVGLSTPWSIVSNCRNAFLGPLKAGAELITKPMSDGIYLWDFQDSANAYFSYTEKLSQAELEAMPEQIPLSHAQAQIDKDYEVRSFFLDGRFYSMAIFSQADESTAVDYRKYNYETPNRNVPYQLPNSVEDCLRLLFSRLGLNTGSVDMIVDPSGQYYFLEINPSGEYDNLQHICNYDLDAKVAEWLRGNYGH